VLDWLTTRKDDPYRGVVRDPANPSVWYGVVPGSDYRDTAVCVAYTISETAHIVYGQSIATLSTPIV
jgi:hypothetical protein